MYSNVFLLLSLKEGKQSYLCNLISESSYRSKSHVDNYKLTPVPFESKFKENNLLEKCCKN